MDFLVNLANGLTGIVSAGADNLVGLLTGILPNVLILLTLINAIVALIGEERVMRVAKEDYPFPYSSIYSDSIYGIVLFYKSDVLYDWALC